MMTFDASAPGRLDVMGGIADYSGSLVLQMALPKKTHVTVQLRDDYACVVKSTLASGDVLEAAADYRQLLKDGTVDYNFARERFYQLRKERWVAYVIGCALVLQKEKNIDFRGASIDILSNVPLGKGVSSSASIEVAVMRALGKAFNLSFTGTELPVLAQRVENHVVGAPCGLMDQLTSYFGEAGTLLPILCQPDDVKEPIKVPDDIFIVALDSGVKHSVGSSAYAEVRCAAFMGYTIIADSLGISREAMEYAHSSGDRSGLPFQGYLSNITVNEYENRFKMLLPASIKGKEFLDRYGVTIDPATRVDEAVHYKVATCTGHPVYEHHRVQRFIERMEILNQQNSSPDKARVLQAMGTCMYQSHESYSRCGLGSEETDNIVRAICCEPGIYGARITGGGQGGAVCVLGSGLAGQEAVRRACELTGSTVI